MITFKSGNIFDEPVTEGSAILNPVNCVGVMGKGLAFQFKKKFPLNYKSYRAACKMKEVNTGKMYITPMFKPHFKKPLAWIINFPTKHHWKDGSKLKYIEEGLKDLVLQIEEREIKKIAIPRLGSGLGGLDWVTVKPLIVEALMCLENIEVVIYE